MTTATMTADFAAENVRAAVPELLDFAARGLPQMFDKQAGLFCHRIQKTERGLVNEGVSPRYTLMTLLGLQRLVASGREFPVNVEATLEGLAARTDWITNLGDLGVLLWTCAKILPGRVEDICNRMDVKSALGRFPDARSGKTTELSWFLTGLSYCAQNGAGDGKLLADLADQTYRLLKGNQGDHGIFGHQYRGAGLTGTLRARVGAFADQVYPIYAFVQYAQAFGAKDALTGALQCATAICRVQGGLGQWWWHYDSVSGDVIGKYPVFSVHQGGMAPMALFALDRAKGTDFSSSIYKGLSWIYGANELNSDFRDPETHLIWRCIEAGRYDRYWRPVAGLLGVRERVRQPAEMRVLHEARPYEIGWLFYAFAQPGVGK